MANLVGIKNPYLHSSPETFYNNLLGKNEQAHQEVENLRSRFDNAIAAFNGKRSMAQQRERQFYAYFKDNNGSPITSAEQWSNAFLINKTKNASISQKVLAVFNSSEMATAISALSKIEESELKNRLIQLSQEVGDKKTQKLIQGLTTITLQEAEKIVGDLLEKEVLKGRKKNSSIKDSEILVPLAQKIQGALPELIKTTGQGRNIGKKKKNRSESIRQATKAITRGRASQSQILNTILAILEGGLADLCAKEEIDYVKKKFIEFFNQGVINLSLFNSGDWSNIVGAVQEVGSVLSINLIQEYQKDTTTTISAKSLGQSFVSRAGLKHQVESKTDTMITFAREGSENRFRIQEKNSLASVYEDLEVVDYLDKKLEQSFARMKVQDKTSLENYYTTAAIARKGGGSFLTDEDMKLLSYVLVNFLTLSSPNYKAPPWKKEGMSRFHKGFSSSVRALIEQLLSLNATIYFSDIITGAEDIVSIDTIDFIIYKSRFLIPMSYIYSDIISFLEDYSKYAIGAAKMGKTTQFYTSFDFNFSAAQAKEMNKKKQAVISQDSNRDYSNPNLLNIGKNYGEEVLSSIFVRSVQLEIDPTRFRNIVSQTFNG